MALFTPISWAQFITPLSEEWANLEDDLKEQMLKGLIQGPTNDINQWRAYQLQHIDSFKRLVEVLIKEHKKYINKATDKTMSGAMEKLNEDMQSNGLPIADDSVVATYMQTVIDDNDKQIQLLGNYVTQKHINNINLIYNNYTNPTVIKEEQVSKAMGSVYQTIINWAYSDVRNGIPVAYSNGRVTSFRAYMDMRVRTEIQDIALNHTVNGALNMGERYFIVSRHVGCAPDHVDIQGCVCCANPTGNQKDLSYVLNKLHRPNCRHSLIPITEEQAQHPDRTLNQIGMSNIRETPRQNETTYKLVQKQRYYERKLRECKTRIDYDKIMLSKPNLAPTLRSKLKSDLTKENKRKNDLNAKITRLINSSPKLYRTELREDAKTFSYTFSN